jgi:hypothetical protein
MPTRGIFQLARDQFRQIALDLIGHFEGTVGRTQTFWHAMTKTLTTSARFL